MSGKLTKERSKAHKARCATNRAREKADAVRETNRLLVLHCRRMLEALEPFAKAYEPLAETNTVPDNAEFQAFLDANKATPLATMGDYRRAFELVRNMKGIES
jgi:hypothetical protein